MALIITLKVKGGSIMYFSLFDKLAKDELSHSELEQIQEDLKAKIFPDSNKTDSKAQE